MRTSSRARHLAAQIEDQILERPYTYDQSVWARAGSCGTIACVGGWAVVLSGYKLYFDSWADRTWNIQNADGTEGPGINPLAKKLLGLNSSEAGWLFDAHAERQNVLDGLAAIREGDSNKFHELMNAEQSRPEHYIPFPFTQRESPL